MDMSKAELAQRCAALSEELKQRREEIDNLEVELKAAIQTAIDEGHDVNDYATLLHQADRAVASVMNQLNRSGYRYSFDNADWKLIQAALERDRACRQFADQRRARSSDAV